MLALQLVKIKELEVCGSLVFSSVQSHLMNKVGTIIGESSGTDSHK